MRATIVAFLSGLALAAAAVHAAPQPPGEAPAAELGAAAPIEPASDGCGHGWHRPRWRDYWGYWHWGHCVPNGGPHDGWSAGWNHPYSDWRGPSGGWGNP
jgi:hypothetical protein